MNKKPFPSIRRRIGVKTMLSAVTDPAGTPYLAFPAFDTRGKVRHAFATRLGGASRGQFATMNLSFTRGDDSAHVLENYRRMANTLGMRAEDVVCTYQTHTVNILAVGREDRGKGVTREREYTDVDGLVTDEEGVVLACFWADCVPLLFADPKRRAIGVAHAGWRGTVGGMAGKMVKELQTRYGCKPQDLYAAIGPSVCADCYEVSEDVATRARDALWKLPAKKGFADWDIPEQVHSDIILRPGKEEGKYLLDLHALNREMLLASGVLDTHIFTTDICTCCNPELLFSHRVQGEPRGNLAAFLTLAERKDAGKP